MIRDTSLQAYINLCESGITGEMHQLIWSFIRDHPGLTDTEIAKGLGFNDINKVRPRRKELLDAGLIVCYGKKTCSFTGRYCYSWIVNNVDGGRNMDLKEEMEKLKAYKGENWFKPEAGQHKVVFVGEPEPDQFIDDEGNVTEQMVFNVQVKAQPYTWSVPRGKTLSSLWGQLVSIASGKGGFNGLAVALIVMGVGKQKRYTVLEASKVVDYALCHEEQAQVRFSGKSMEDLGLIPHFNVLERQTHLTELEDKDD